MRRATTNRLLEDIVNVHPPIRFIYKKLVISLIMYNDVGYLQDKEFYFWYFLNKMKQDVFLYFLK